MYNLQVYVENQSCSSSPVRKRPRYVCRRNWDNLSRYAASTGISAERVQEILIAYEQDKGVDGDPLEVPSRCVIERKIKIRKSEYEEKIKKRVEFQLNECVQKKEKLTFAVDGKEPYEVSGLFSRQMTVPLDKTIFKNPSTSDSVLNNSVFPVLEKFNLTQPETLPVLFFNCDTTSLLSGRISGVATQLNEKFPFIPDVPVTCILSGFF